MSSEHVKYVVEIKQVYQTTETVAEQFCTKETPTDKHDGYSRPAMAKEYDIRDVTKREFKERSVYRQEASAIDLVGVINAVNAKASS